MQLKQIAVLLFGMAVAGVMANPMPNDASLEVRAEQNEQMTQFGHAQSAQNAAQHGQADQDHADKQDGQWWPYPRPRPRPQPNNWCPPYAWWCRQPGPRPNNGCQWGGISQCVDNYCNPIYSNFLDRYGTCTSGTYAGCQCDKCGGSDGGHVGSCSASNGCFGQNGICQGGQYAGCPCKDDAWVWKA